MKTERWISQTAVITYRFHLHTTPTSWDWQKSNPASTYLKVYCLAQVIPDNLGVIRHFHWLKPTDSTSRGYFFSNIVVHRAFCVGIGFLKFRKHYPSCSNETYVCFLSIFSVGKATQHSIRDVFLISWYSRSLSFTDFKTAHWVMLVFFAISKHLSLLVFNMSKINIIMIVIWYYLLSEVWAWSLGFGLISWWILIFFPKVIKQELRNIAHVYIIWAWYLKWCITWTWHYWPLVYMLLSSVFTKKHEIWSKF